MPVSCPSDSYMTYTATPLVGREHELELIQQLLEGTSAGEARFLFVSGEPGIGKTRMLTELLGLAKRAGCVVLHGSAAEFERELPFGLLVDAVDEFLESLDPVVLQRLDASDLMELAGVFPALRSFDPGSDEPTTAGERFRAHRAVSELLERLAERHAVILGLDDLHWADSASLELLSRLLRRRPRGRVGGDARGAGGAVAGRTRAGRGRRRGGRPLRAWPRRPQRRPA